MSLPVLEKHPIKIDDFEFIESQLERGKITWKGVIVDDGLEFFKPLDLPASYLSKNTARKMKLIPMMLDTALEDEKIRNLVVLTTDSKPLSIFSGDRQILQYDELYECVDNHAKTLDMDDTKYELMRDGSIKVISWSKDVRPITPRVGDTLRGGTIFKYSPGLELVASAIAERFVCANGATRVHEKHTWRGGNDIETQKDFIATRMRMAMLSNANMYMAAYLLAATKLPDGMSPAEFIRQLCVNFGITGQLVETIVGAFNADGDVVGNPTQWDIINAFTHAFTHLTAPEKGLQDIAGTIMYEVGANGITLVDARVPQMIADMWGDKNGRN